MRFLVTVCLSLMCAICADAQKRVVDPFFGIEFDPMKVHFDRIPLSLKNRCSEVRERYARAWVFGHLKREEAEYFILYGYINVKPEEHSKSISSELEDDDGIIVAVQGTACRMDQWQYFFRKQPNPSKYATPVEASDEVMNALAEDIFRRYASALGGKREFLQKFSKKDREQLPPFLQQRLEMYARKP